MRVALAEDGALFREGLLMLLQAAGHEVVAVAAGGDELISLLATTPADVAILDIRMPPEPDGGLITAERLRGKYPEMGLLFLSHYAESHYLMRILEIGTDSIGYRLKERVGSVEVLSDTLGRIADGEIVIEPVLAKRLVERPRGLK
jgi:DNA-binding NarL/FixJ family response regulator